MPSTSRCGSCSISRRSFIGARLHFIGVTQQVTDVHGFVFRHQAPLQTSGEARAAAPFQASVFYRRDNLIPGPSRSAYAPLHSHFTAILVQPHRLLVVAQAPVSGCVSAVRITVFICTLLQQVRNCLRRQMAVSILINHHGRSLVAVTRQQVGSRVKAAIKGGLPRLDIQFLLNGGLNTLIAGDVAYHALSQ